ncbi:uncharacterized protein TNCV_4859611 [Trichonephila clavipes]|nr:uncharacterized protein TNCV_4859611 [Trichonephila clavipes]
MDLGSPPIPIRLVNNKRRFPGHFIVWRRRIPFNFQRTSLAGLALDSATSSGLGRAPALQCRTPSRHHLELQDRRDYTPADRAARTCCKQEQTILTHFRSGHLRTLTFNDGKKVLPCIRCSACQASPKHIIDCLGLTKQDLYEDPLMVLDFLRVKEIMDLVQLG